jgi:hypothetical protein
MDKNWPTSTQLSTNILKMTGQVYVNKNPPSPVSTKIIIKTLNTQYICTKIVTKKGQVNIIYLFN